MEVPVTRVTIVTLFGRYRGGLQLISAAGQTVRLLDLLNYPQRLQPGGAGGIGRSAPGLVLHQATRSDLRRSEEFPCGEVTTLRPESVVMAWEEETNEQTSSARVAALGYEKRVLAEKGRVFIHQVNGLRLEGSMAGGLVALEPGRLAGKSFVPLTDVILIDPVVASPPSFIPFAAVNVHQAESFGAL
jgi:hypothetical protein